jgi:hypothetical protein
MSKTLLPISLLSLMLLTVCSQSSIAPSVPVESEPQLARTPQAQVSPPFLIGVLRSDGVLVPFAKYSQSQWSPPWPKPASSTEETPTALTELKKPWFTQNGKPSTAWYFYSWEGEQQVLTTSKVVRAINHSGTNWGLATDYPPKSGVEKHQRIVGIALETPHEVAGIDRLTDASPDWNMVVTFIEPTFEKIERDKIADPASAIGERETSVFPQSEAERRKTRLTLVQLYRNKASLDGRYIYYFEARKEYSSSSTDTGCANLSVLQGWILRNQQGEFTLLERQHSFTDCDQKGQRSVEAFIVLLVDNRRFLITQEHGWEDESYAVMELKDSSLSTVLEVMGG